MRHVNKRNINIHIPKNIIILSFSNTFNILIFLHVVIIVKKGSFKILKG